MFRQAFFYVFAINAMLWADTITLKSGNTIQGTYLGGDSRNVRVAVGERVESVNVGEIARIEFGEATSATSSPARQNDILTPRPLPASSPATQTAVKGSQVAAGSEVVVRMIDDVDSERDTVGKTFRASVDEPVLSGENIVIPKGTDVTIKLVADKQSGKLEGRTELTLDLVSIRVDGRDVDVLSQSVTQASASRTARTGKVVGGTAALGAIIGAIAGGGSGAAIGAVSGAAAGGAVQVMTKGQRVRIPTETRLSFTLERPLTL
jgi:hypothetical protein